MKRITSLTLSLAIVLNTGVGISLLDAEGVNS